MTKVIIKNLPCGVSSDQLFNILTEANITLENRNFVIAESFKVVPGFSKFYSVVPFASKELALEGAKIIN